MIIIMLKTRTANIIFKTNLPLSSDHLIYILLCIKNLINGWIVDKIHLIHSVLYNIRYI